MRSRRRMNRAWRLLSELDLESDRFYRKCEFGDAMIGLRNGIVMAQLVLEQVTQCVESRDCHYRID